MNAFFIAWGVSAGVLLVAAAILGVATKGGILGILIDTRGRYSLTHLQLALWTIVIIPLIFGLLIARLAAGPVSTAFNFDLPGELLAVIGISVGSAATSITVKSYKNTSTPESVATSDPTIDPPSLAQIFLAEDGPMADKVIDISKFQNFWFTLILMVGYVALVIGDAQGASSVASFTLPGFSTTFVTLLGISHAGYLAAKLPGGGQPTVGLNIDDSGRVPSNSYRARQLPTPEYAHSSPTSRLTTAKRVSVSNHVVRATTREYVRAAVSAWQSPRCLVLRLAFSWFPTEASISRATPDRKDEPSQPSASTAYTCVGNSLPQLRTVEDDAHSRVIASVLRRIRGRAGH